MKLSIQITDRIDEWAEAWDEFLPAKHHLRSADLKSFERSAVPDVDTAYVQVYQKDKLVGVLYLQQFCFKHHHLNFGDPPALLARCLKGLLPKRLPILVCGNLYRIDFPGYYFKNPARPTWVLEALQLFLEENKKYRPCGIILKDCEALMVEEHYKPFGFHFFNGDVTMELNRRAHWFCFDDYLKDLTKNYHQRARKIIKASDSVQVREFGADDIMQNEASIEGLYWNVVSKQTVKLGTVNVAYFSELKRSLRESFEFYAMFENGIMVGFYTFIFYEHHMETHYIGLDYEANHRLKLYFNILFRSVERMIDGNYQSLELGRTAREAKMNLGALPKQIFNYTRVSNPLVRVALNYFLDRFNRTANPPFPERNPLK